MSDKQSAPILPPLSGGGGNNGGNNGGATQQTVSLQQVLATAQGLNVLTTGGGQQFVITSQVPGLTQVITSSATTNTNVQQVGVTRIVNISNTTPRVSTVGVPSASSTPLTSPSRQTSTKVVLATSPKLVRTSMGNMFIAPSSQVSMQSPPARKRLKLTENTEKVTATADDGMSYRKRIIEHKMKRMRAIREKYAENASELFFLHAGGNMMDFQAWKKRPPTSQYLHFLRQHRLDPDDDDEDLTVPLPSIREIPLSPVTTSASTTVPTNQNAEVKISGVGVTPVAVSTTLPAAVAQLSQQGQVPGRPQGGRHGMVFAFRAAIQSSPVTVHPPPTSTLAPTLIIGGTPLVPEMPKHTTPTNPVSEKTPTTPVVTKAPSPSRSTSQPVVKLMKLSTTSAVSSDITNNQEQIVEKAKQEAYVMQKIAELQRDGLWSERRLPKVQEPARTKAHWDYLLEEMVWLAADFAQERKWKKAAAKKCARMVQKHFQEKAIQAQKAEKSQELRLKKIASFVAKEIKTFWANVEKLVEYKQQTRLEEKRKKALDQHLNFIVGQTEKYSTWLTEGLNKTDGSQSIPASINSSRISSPVPTGKSPSDEEFQPNQSSDDDEETIAKAEEEMKSTTDQKEEIELLKKESEMPLEDLLKDLPPNYLEERNKSLSPSGKEVKEAENEKSSDKDTDFVAASDESSDEEDTIMEQEKMEGNTDHRQELDDLKAENEMSIDELMAKYGNMSNVPMDVEEDDDAQESDKETDQEKTQENEEQVTSSESESEESDEAEDSQMHSDTETDVGLKSLLEEPSTEKPSENKTSEADHVEDAHNEMDNVAALAESIQPKGNTLLTTCVVTKIPFLLKHSLREYQHIGLDWLVTMYDRKLNGILADEMGLGKTIQTIALLAHLACEKGNWGPHLIIVPTSVMLNWEMECKKWCPGFKILTYYGTQKERKQKRTGWTKPNAFHICITSYKLVIQDHQSFRRKKWKYLILDEAQNIKNFKSQRWQLLLNFQTQRRLLLTGTPLQNNLMELWSLMHFLMPNVFQSHREFKEWFSNPVTGMIEGNSEYNEKIIRRLHKVLRPFLLRRLKTEVEKQLPKKYEHVVMCRLSKRQRYLYDDFMSRAKTKETLASGNLLSVINVLMQLRKVCNHPNLFEVRPTVSPFQMEAIEFITASLVWSVLDYDPFKHIDLSTLNLLLLDSEFTLTAFGAHRIKRLKTSRKLIEEIDNQPDPPPRCPSGKIKINVRLSNQVKPSSAPQPAQTKVKSLAGILPTPRVGTSPLIKSFNNQSTPGQGVTLRVAGGQQLQGYSVQLVQHQGSVKAIPVGTLAHNSQSTTITSTTASMNAQRITVGNANIRDGLQRLATQTVTVKQGDSVQRIPVPGFAQLVQTSTGRHIILTSNQQNTNTVSFPVMTPTGQRLTVLSKSLMGLATSATTVNKVVGGVVTTTTSGTSGRPVMRVPPLNVTGSQAQSTAGNGQPTHQQTLRCGIITRHTLKESEKTQAKEQPKSEFHLPQLEEERKQRRQGKLRSLANINEGRCAACPLYGEDLFTALRIGKPSTACSWHNGLVNCKTAKIPVRTRKQFFSCTEALAEAIKSTERIVEELKEVFERFVVYVPAVRAPVPRFHVSHPPPHKLWNQRRMQIELQRELSPKMQLFHPVTRSMMTQFPEPRLIQYDCGKLQSLDLLLRKLKSENHRVLIFTQMTRMLDVLEAFLNFHGHIYLRLDGTTRVDQRQVLMERFNGDKRIFCFILSTRSGGVGVNLTGADTVIFYDSDWNPTMDAQAQDRCHRIGQTRDVHIYRLVSEKTVEENILKKANQKRLLGDLAIEGGNFTTAYFKSSTIQDLFNIDQSENDASTRMAEVLEHVEDKVAMGALESALAAAEEDLDVQAAKIAKAEAVADLAEFDENIPLDDVDKEDVQVSKAEQEVQNLVSQLTPIERYAMKFVEESEGAFSAAQLAAAERELEEQKKEWEMDRLRALREEEERRMRLADDDEKPLTFGREDAQNQVNSANNSKKLVSKKVRQGSSGGNRRRRRRGSRKRNSRSTRESSESETDTTTESDSDSQEEDVVEDSLDEESSHTESQSQGDEEDEEEETDNRNDSERGSYPKRNNRSNKPCDQNHFDLNSPRTRSRGNVKINLWTLDVSPILPGVKPKCRRRSSKRKKIDLKGNEATATISASSLSQIENDLNTTGKSNDSDEDDDRVKPTKAIEESYKKTTINCEENSSSNLSCQLQIDKNSIKFHNKGNSSTTDVVKCSEFSETEIYVKSDDTKSASVISSNIEDTISQINKCNVVSEKCFKSTIKILANNETAGEEASSLQSSSSSIKRFDVTTTVSEVKLELDDITTSVDNNKNSEPSEINFKSEKANSLLNKINKSIDNVKHNQDKVENKNPINESSESSENVEENPIRNNVKEILEPINEPVISKILIEETTDKSNFSESNSSSMYLSSDDKSTCPMSNSNSKSTLFAYSLSSYENIQNENSTDPVTVDNNETKIDSRIDLKESNSSSLDEHRSVDSDTTFQSIDNSSVETEDLINESVTENSVISIDTSQKFTTEIAKNQVTEDDDQLELSSTVSTLDDSLPTNECNDLSNELNKETNFEKSEIPKKISTESSKECSNNELKSKSWKSDLSSTLGVTTRSAKAVMLLENSNNNVDSEITSNTNTKLEEISSCDMKNIKLEVTNRYSNVALNSQIVTAKVTMSRTSDSNNSNSQSASDYSRVTRSSVNQSMMLTAIENSYMQKSQRRRPGTPSSDLKSLRPITRSTAINSSTKNDEHISNKAYEKPTTRSSKSSLDNNGFLNPVVFRRSRSIPPMKSSTTESNELSSTAQSKAVQKKVVGSSESTSGNQKHRPGTPVPTTEKSSSRVTRSGQVGILNYLKTPSTSAPVLRGNRHIRKSDSSLSIKGASDEQKMCEQQNLSTDTNGNAVATEEAFSQENDQIKLTFSEVKEKPQRTAKVVAILTLDTRNNHNIKTNNSKNSNSATSESKQSNKKNSDNILEISNKRLSNTISNLKNEVKHINESTQRDETSNVNSTYLNSNKTANAATNPLKTNNTEKVSLKSTVITLVGINNDTLTEVTSKKSRKKMKRTRLTSANKSGPVSTESKIGDTILETFDTEELQIQPLKKSVRLQSPSNPPPSLLSSEKEKTTMDKFSGDNLISS
ncbi:PREDICTED: helicase domino isoform X2 [Polistes canadensis]|nr:PREDICTED: helicase domino isoform X2 [Polistes canadensis]